MPLLLASSAASASTHGAHRPLTRLLLLASSVASAFAHGALVSPRARNAFDASLFANGSACNCGDPEAGCVQANRAGMNGQSCFWFSQGCFIGCANCTGTDIQPDGLAPNATGPHATCAPSDQPAGASSMPTLPKRLWTMNRAAVEDSSADIYRFHPWRAPGSAPVVDGCGVAGGTTPSHAGPGHASFAPVELDGSHVSQGDLGSAALPRGPAQATWTVGATVEVKWGLRFNHGGGYIYRLCPATEPLTEDCFQRHPMAFARGTQALERKDGSRTPVPAASQQYIDEGVIPVGAGWARNPIPPISGGHAGCAAEAHGAAAANATDARGIACRQFAPPCGDDDDGWAPTPGTHEPTEDAMGACSGNWIGGVIVDEVIVPPLPAGDYVLGFRWDSEATSQVWSSCADVTLVASSRGMR